ncbi:DNA mismatch repair protein MutS2 [Clostridiales Family XIII bacterium PM5-7]
MNYGTNRRLANVKTRTETGLEYVMSQIDLNTPFGKSTLKATKPFFPGEEEGLRRELDKVDDMIRFTENNRRAVDLLSEAFMEIKDITYTIERSGNNALSVVELYDVKSLLLMMRKIDQICSQTDTPVPEEFVLEPTEELLDVLDPNKDRINTFYLYDEFSEKLSEMRKEKHGIEVGIRKQQKARKEEIRKEYGIILTPKFDCAVSKSGGELEKYRSVPDLEQVDEDYMTVTFQLKAGDEVYALTAQMEELVTQIEEEETVVRQELSLRIAEFADVLKENCQRIGYLDVALGKALYAIKHQCVKPEIVDEHIVEIVEGRHLKVEDVLKSKSKSYCPVSISLSDGVSCITGANMGGKTISLKLAGLIPILTQYGFFVPCQSAKIGLSNYMQILIGDSQSVERGLSSFGSEMEELKEILDHSGERSLILIDEIASGTNPVEGLALTRSLVEYLKERPYITLITTHFETVTEEEGVRNMQVRGLADVDFQKLDRELKYANRKERINIISKYMDYRLYTVEKHGQVPKDAINIAKMLGINKEIIDGAQKYIK